VSEQQSAAACEFSNIIPERLWLTIDNQVDKKVKITLEINGQDKVLEHCRFECFDPEQGHYLHSWNLTWLLANARARDKAEIERLRKALEHFRLGYGTLATTRVEEALAEGEK